jgi:hypothetical protein
LKKMNEPIEELIKNYREENRGIGGPWKPFKTQRVKCEAVDLAGNPVEGDCVECVSHKPNWKDYGWLAVRGTKYWLHRLSWELANGSPIPEGYQVDHVCRNRKCINPKHLQLLSAGSHSRKTQVENGKLTTNLLLLRGVCDSEEVYQVWARRGSFATGEFSEDPFGEGLTTGSPSPFKESIRGAVC